LAHAVEPVRVQKAAIGRNSDDRLSHVHLLIILNGPRYGACSTGAIVAQRRGDAPRRIPSRGHVLSAPKGPFWPDYVAPHEPCPGPGGLVILPRGRSRRAIQDLKRPVMNGP